MNRNNDGCGCGVLLLVSIVLGLVIFFAIAFVGNLYKYSQYGHKDDADIAGLFFLLLVGILYVIYKILKS